MDFISSTSTRTTSYSPEGQHRLQPQLTQSLTCSERLKHSQTSTSHPTVTAPPTHTETSRSHFKIRSHGSTNPYPEYPAHACTPNLLLHLGYFRMQATRLHHSETATCCAFAHSPHLIGEAGRTATRYGHGVSVTIWLGEGISGFNYVIGTSSLQLCAQEEEHYRNIQSALLGVAQCMHCFSAYSNEGLFSECGVGIRWTFHIPFYYM